MFTFVIGTGTLQQFDGTLSRLHSDLQTGKQSFYTKNISKAKKKKSTVTSSSDGVSTQKGIEKFIGILVSRTGFSKAAVRYFSRGVSLHVSHSEKAESKFLVQCAKAGTCCGNSER